MPNESIRTIQKCKIESPAFIIVTISDRIGKISSTGDQIRGQFFKNEQETLFGITRCLLQRLQTSCPHAISWM